MKNILAQKTFFIKTYGCQMNKYDSGKMAALLQQEGMTPVLSVEEADAVILNTCHIREKARHKVLTELGFLRSTKNDRIQKGKPTVLAVGGCIAQAEGSEIIHAAPYVDIIFGTQVYHRLPKMLRQAFGEPLEEEGSPSLIHIQKAASHIVDIEFPMDDKFDCLPKQPQTKGAAFLAIQEGCDKFCTYCVVPYTRGVEISRPVSSILEEANIIADSGVCEITLLGQNVNAYQGTAPNNREEHWGFAKLLRALAQIKGIMRIFYTSSHPIDFELDLIHAHAELPNLMPFIHLPVQSGSNAVLKAMNRGYTVESYKALVDKIKETCPSIAFASDFIVGFPGETEEDFEKTLELVRYVQYSQAFSFKYSARPGTPASAMPQQINETIKEQRLQMLQNLLEQQQKAFNERCIGKNCSVMFQQYGKKQKQALGKSDAMQSVVVSNVDPDLLLNSIHKVRIISASLSCLEGQIID